MLYNQTLIRVYVKINPKANELRNRSMCPRITKLLYYMYTNQVCTVNV